MALPGVTFRWTETSLFAGLENFEKKTLQEMEDRVTDYAEVVLDYMQTHAPWEDRTGQARDQLTATPYGGQMRNEAGQFASGHLIGIQLAHGVDYGIWLEIRWGGIYAIIQPTIEALGDDFMNTFSDMLEDIDYP